MTISETQKILKEFKSELNKKFPGEVRLMFLFGSMALGTATKNSDVDILLVVKDKKVVSDFVDDFVIKTILRGGPYLSVKLYDEKEYKRLTTPSTFFMREIQTQGIKV